MREPWINLDNLPTQTFLRSPATDTWANPSTLDEHYIDHAADFNAASPEDYAEQANEFYENAKQRGIRTKVDTDGTVRIYDPKTDTFGSYTEDGRTITFFKPGGRSYFDRQPGQLTKRVEFWRRLDIGKTRKAMSNETKFTCPVCGYPNLEKPPRSKTTGGSYEICACCGFEFGYHDEAKGISDEEWRRRWIAKGMPWSARLLRPPPNWNPTEQLFRISPSAGSALDEGSHGPAFDRGRSEFWEGANGTDTLVALEGPAAAQDGTAPPPPRYICPVCGCDRFETPPQSTTEGGLYEYCPCCNFHFGFHADELGITPEKWRRRWVFLGMPWLSNLLRPPPHWNLVDQLRRLAPANSEPTGPASSGGGD